jgi:predicted RND superfamily exporter protein
MGKANGMTAFDRFIQKYIDWIIRWRWLVVITTLLITFFLANGAQYLSFDTNYRVFFGKDNPQLQTFEALQNIYTKNDNILFVITSENNEIFSPKTLDAVEKLTTESWQIPYSIRVDAISNFQHTRGVEDELIVEDLVENALQKSSEELKNVKVIALSEPIIFKRLLSENANVTGVNVTLQFPGNDISEVPAAVGKARDLAHEIEATYPGLKIYITGVAMLNAAFSEASMSDMQTLTPLMYLAMFIIMIFALRSVSGTIATMLVVSFSMIAAMGIAGWFRTGLTPPSAQAPTIIMTLAIADSIHILVTLIREMRNGRSKFDAIRESFRVNLQPVFLTSLSTIIGFLTMNFSKVPPFNHLGNITAAGITAAFLYSIIFLPAFIAILPVKVRPVSKKGKSLFMEKIAEFIIQQRRPLFYGGVFVAMALAVFIIKNDLNDSFVEYFDDSIQFRRDTDFTTQNLTGIYQAEFSLGALESGGIGDPAYLSKVEEYANWYRQQPNILHVSTFTDVMKRLNKNMHGDDQTYYRIPESRELAAQYLLLYEMSLPYGLDLNNQINIDKSATRFIVTMEDVSAKEIVHLTEIGEQWLRDNAPEHMFSVGASPSVMFANISRINIRSMINGSIIALLLISGMMIFALRSLKIGLISLIPNLMPAAMAFGLWGIISGKIDIGLSIVMGMTLGIVVDDTIHFLSKYLRARRESNMEPEDAVRYAFSTVGWALVVTSFILVIGFFVLSFSAFSMNGNMAKLTAITLAIALIADFLFLPPLLLRLEQFSPVVKKDDELVDGIPLTAQVSTGTSTIK